ncbi:hypothetical protein A0H76_1018 [Hepatospora eriocheir]|uniref:Nuclear pore protein n=1 Tax=Hepatospora eriocheir TaxID=1081669 RepID=A0A1X0QHY0_9MICR|nr:hypothetical protein A0H76_1018 [Hepatospora eriocheir]
MIQFINNKKSEFEFLNFKVFFDDTTENDLFTEPSASSFSDELLFDCFTFLKNQITPIKFLENGFKRHMVKFFETQQEKENISYPDCVQDYVRLKYSTTAANMAVYEGRYLWAEIYVLFRLGMYNEIKELFAKFNTFFNKINGEFATYFLQYLNSGVNTVGKVNCNERDDKFKIVMVGFLEGNVVNEPYVISSVEDYLFMLLNNTKKIDTSVFMNPRIEFLASLMAGSYQKAFKLVLRSEFNIVAKFHLLNVLSYSIDLVDSEIPDRELADKTFRENCRVFCMFVFKIIDKLTLYHYKLNLVEMLQDNNDYANYIPEFIIKHNLIEMVKEDVIKNKIKERIISELIGTDKKKLLKILQYLDDSVIEGIFEDLLEQAILTDHKLPQNINLSKAEGKKAEDLRDLYIFNFEPSISNLKSTILVDPIIDLRPYKFIIEHVFRKALHVCKESKDKEISRILFEINGKIDLNEECSSLLINDFLMFI